MISTPISSLTAQAIADTRLWLERAVIGLNLCPFAKAVHVKRQVHYAVCLSTEAPELLSALEFELKELLDIDAVERDTTLLIAPNICPDFLDFNDLLYQADRTLKAMKLKGVIQIAAFHPQFQFADSEPEDIGNFTNRSPYPTLHLLREESIDKAVASFPDPEAIFEKNIQTLEQLGHSGWAALGLKKALA